MPSIILRPRGLFGVGDTSILPRVLRLSRKIGIPLIRGGEQLMDMTCVENVALAIPCLWKPKKHTDKFIILQMENQRPLSI